MMTKEKLEKISKLMFWVIPGMNGGHAKMADWGMSVTR